MKFKSEIENIFETKDSLKIIRESARDFALQYIKPYVLDWDENPCSIEEKYLTRFVKQGILSGVNLETTFIDIGIPQDYEYFKNNFIKITNE